MTTATELAALTERLSMHMDASEKAWDQVEKEQAIASTERQAMLAALADLRRDMQSVKPVTDMVTSLRARVSGGLIVLGFIGAIAWAGVLFFKDAILRLLMGE